MADWRDRILGEFTPGVERLTVVADPDGLLAEEGILGALQARGFEVVSFEDRIAFRFFYESRYRSHRDRGDLADLVVVVGGEESGLHEVPYDVLQAGRRLSFQLGDLFPKLSRAVVGTLDRGDFDALHTTLAREPPARPLGASQTREFLLRHVFGIAPETIRKAPDLLRFLLRRHYGRRRLPPDLERHLVQALQQDRVFAQWPLARIVPDREAFFAFLQERWPIFLDRPASESVALRDTAADYGLAFSGPARIPFDHPDVRVYIDNLFLEGALRPIPHPGGHEVAGSWALAGIEIDPQAHRRRRLDGLLKSIEEKIPKDAGVTPGVARIRTTLGAGERARLRRRRGCARRDRSGTVPQHPRSDRRGVHRVGPAALRNVAQSATVAAGDDPPDSPVARAASAGIQGREGRARRDGRAGARPVGGGSRVARATAAGVAVPGGEPVRLDPHADHGVPTGLFRGPPTVVLRNQHRRHGP